MPGMVLAPILEWSTNKMLSVCKEFTVQKKSEVLNVKYTFQSEIPDAQRNNEKKLKDGAEIPLWGSYILVEI